MQLVLLLVGKLIALHSQDEVEACPKHLYVSAWMV